MSFHVLKFCLKKLILRKLSQTEIKKIEATTYNMAKKATLAILSGEQFHFPNLIRFVS